jgi:hypothetical protein
MCHSPARDEQELAKKRWSDEQTERCRAAYAPLLPPENVLHAAIVADLRRQNAARPMPDPVCKACGFPICFEERDPLFKKRCSQCASRHLDKIMCRIRRRLGRRAAIRALRRLAGGR